MKTEQRRKRMKLESSDVVVAESPMKFSPDSSAVPSSVPTSHIMRRSSFYSEKPSRVVSKYTKLEERMTHKMLSPPSQKFNSTYVAGSWLTSPRRITPKSLFGSLLSPSPSKKSSTTMPRKLDLQSPVRSLGCSASLDFKSPVKTVLETSASSTVGASPLKPTASSLSQLGLDSPSRNTRSHTSAVKQALHAHVVTQQPEMLALPSSLGRQYSRLMSPSPEAVISPDSKQSPRKKSLSVDQSLPLLFTFSSASQPVQLLGKSSGKAEDIRHSNCSNNQMSAAGRSVPHFPENNVSHKRKKTGKSGVISKSSTRKRSFRQLCSDSHLLPDEQHTSAIATNVYDDRLLDKSALFTTLSFGCDVETNDGAVADQKEQLNSDVLRHLGSSGVESESSSNDVDLMIARKNLLGRKCSSGFQSLGHISETDYCPSPVFPTISTEAVIDSSEHSGEHTAFDSLSVSPVFGKRQTQSFAGESPCLSLPGSGCKRTPVPGCTNSFSPDVSQHSIAHLMTSPLLDGTETQMKTTGNRSSTRRCLDQQMYQSSKHLSGSKHNSG